MSRRDKLWPSIAVVLIVLVFGYQILCGFRSLRYLMQHVFIADYAFYYFQIARNIAHYGWSTFDRIHSTGGAQLLWSGILSALATFISDKILFLRGVFLLSAALNAISGILFYRLGSALRSQRAGAHAVLIWSGLVIRQHPTNMGTEFPLHMVIILLLALNLYQLFSGNAKPITLGILLTLNFWTRIDSIFYSFFILITIGILLKKSGNLRKAVILPAFICTGGGIAYWILCNHLSQTPIPISSLAKHYYASRFFDSVDSSVSFQQYLRWIFENPGRLIYSLLAPYQFIGKYFGLIQIILITLVLGMFLSFYVLAYRKRSADARSSNISKSILIFYIFGFLHMILVVIAVANYSKSTLHYYGWFYGTVCMSTAISFCYLLSLLSSVSLRRLIATIAIALFLYPNFWFIWTQASQEQEIYLNTSRMETAEWIRMNLPKNARIGAWNTGIIGYFSDRTVINLDGMANDKSYLDFLRSGQPIQSYLQKENIQYICDTNTIDLSMRFGEKWNRSKSFRDAIPMKDLILLNGDQKGPIRVYEMKVAN